LSILKTILELIGQAVASQCIPKVELVPLSLTLFENFRAKNFKYWGAKLEPFGHLHSKLEVNRGCGSFVTLPDS